MYSLIGMLNSSFEEASTSITNNMGPISTTYEPTETGSIYASVRDELMASSQQVEDDPVNTSAADTQESSNIDAPLNIEASQSGDTDLLPPIVSLPPRSSTPVRYV